MEKDIDLSGVDPARWPEIRRRVAILDEFVAIWRPSADLRKEFADRIGVSGSQLMNLARVWRTDRSAAALPGAKSRHANRGARRISPRAAELAAETIRDLGPLARRKEVLEEVGRRCALEGVDPPSDSTIANMLADARSGTEDALDMAPEILIDECIVKLPVADGDVLAMPRVLLAVVLPARRIVAMDICCDSDRAPSLSKVMDDLEAATTPARGVPLELRAAHRSALERAAIGALPRDSTIGRPSLGRILGARIDTLDVVYQASKARSPEVLLRDRFTSPMSPADAQTAIEAAVFAHNARMPALPARGFRLAART